VEVSVRGLDRNAHISAGCSACRPDVTALVHRVWIKAYFHFKVTSCHDSAKHPVVHRIQHELGSLPGVASDCKLLILIYSHIEEGTTIVDNVGNIKFVARSNRIFNINADEVPAGVATASVDFDDAELALAHVESTMRVIDAKGHASIDVVILVKLT